MHTRSKQSESKEPASSPREEIIVTPENTQTTTTDMQENTETTTPETSENITQEQVEAGDSGEINPNKNDDITSMLALLIQRFDKSEGENRKSQEENRKNYQETKKDIRRMEENIKEQIKYQSIELREDMMRMREEDRKERETLREKDKKEWQELTKKIQSRTTKLENCVDENTEAIACNRSKLETIQEEISNNTKDRNAALEIMENKISNVTTMVDNRHHQLNEELLVYKNDICSGLDKINSKLLDKSPINNNVLPLSLINTVDKEHLPTFFGDRRLHPVKYLQNIKNHVEMIYKNDYITHHPRIMNVIKNTIKAEAELWLRIVEDRCTDFYTFEKEFLKQYWSVQHQNKIRDKLIMGKYDKNLGDSREQYAIKLYNQAMYLEPKMSEKDLITRIAGHYNEDISLQITIKDIDTLSIFLEYLRRIDEIEERNKKRPTAFVNNMRRGKDQEDRRRNPDNNNENRNYQSRYTREDRNDYTRLSYNNYTPPRYYNNDTRNSRGSANNYRYNNNSSSYQGRSNTHQSQNQTRSDDRNYNNNHNNYPSRRRYEERTQGTNRQQTNTQAANNNDVSDPQPETSQNFH